MRSWAWVVAMGAGMAIAGCTTSGRGDGTVVSGTVATNRPGFPGIDEPSESETARPFTMLERELLEAHNQYRSVEGLEPLELSARLCEAAEVHAKAMAKTGEVTHEGPEDESEPSERVARTGYKFRATGENIAMGQKTVEEVMKAWMDSPGHRKNILGDFQELGVARVKDDEGRPYWAVEFGTPWKSLNPEKAAEDVRERINARRKEDGLKPVVLDEELGTIASEEAKALAALKELSEYDGGRAFEAIRERGIMFGKATICVGVGLQTPEKLVEHFLESPRERESLLGDFGKLGVGVANREDGTPCWILLLTGPPER